MSIGRTYHVLSIFIDHKGKRYYTITGYEREDEWPHMAGHLAECFEIVSTIVPSNWRPWLTESAIGISPLAWQDPNFSEALFNRDPASIQIFVGERDLILSEDP